MTAPLSHTQVMLPPPESSEGMRRRRYALHDAAGRLLAGRIGACGKHPIGGGGTPIMKAPGRAAYFAGVETCSSIWTCPRCAPRIAEKRRGEVAHAVDLWTRCAGTVWMAAFTIPHNRGQACKPLREAVARCWGKVQAGSPWKRLKQSVGLDHTIRAMEVTHGANGWHPHIHVLFFMPPDVTDEQAQIFGWRVFDRWARMVERAGFDNCNPSIFKFERARNSDAAGDYVAKWGSDREICFGHMKKGKQGGRSPWQILDDYSQGDGASGGLFKEYAEAFFRARHLTWSRGTKDHFGICELTDADIAGADDLQAETIATVAATDYRNMAYDGKLPALLEAAEADGERGVQLVVQRWRLDYEKRKSRYRRGGSRKQASIPRAFASGVRKTNWRPDDRFDRDRSRAG